jgi:hypothetical protein
MEKYVLIHFTDRKPIKKHYDSAFKAFYEHEDKGCVLVELYNHNGIKLSSYKKSC